MIFDVEYLRIPAGQGFAMNLRRRSWFAGKLGKKHFRFFMIWSIADDRGNRVFESSQIK